MGPMLARFSEWRERHRTKMESFEWFVSGGGFGVVEVADEQELYRLMLEFPFAFTDEIEVRPVVDGDRALQSTREALAALAAT
jgi:hypothetical protein